jgi:predicted nuclease with TOPRIM domain
MADITVQILTEIREEAREARAETQENFKTVFHRLSLMEASMNDVKHRLTSLERHMAALLATVPVMNERIDRLEARLAALETRTP